jgi:hypothetical protein
MRNTFSALEHVAAKVDINSVVEAVGNNINISANESLRYCELKKHAPCFNGGSSK